MYFLTEPNSFCSFRNSPALWIVALIVFSFRTIPVLPINVFTSFALNFATFGRENWAKAFWKSGHLFSTTLQLSPAVKTDLVSRSKYSASSFGGFILLGDMMRTAWDSRIFMRPAFLGQVGLT